jgi:hypothetical protein
MGRTVIFLFERLPSVPNQKPYPIRTNIQERTNILLTQVSDSEASVLVVFSVASDDSNKLLVIDPNTVTSLARQKGDYRLAASWKVGDLESPGTGATLLRDSVSRFLAIPIDKMVVVTPAGWESLKAKFGSTPEAVNRSLISKVFLLNLLIISVPEGVSGDISFLKLTQLNLTAGHNLRRLSLDKSGADSLDLGAIDRVVSANFAEDRISRFHPKVSLVNSSGVAGAATALARYIHNLGGEVIRADTAGPISQSQIRDHLGGSSLSKRLSPLIGAQIITDQKPSRADIEIVIGQNAKDIF